MLLCVGIQREVNEVSKCTERWSTKCSQDGAGLAEPVERRITHMLDDFEENGLCENGAQRGAYHTIIAGGVTDAVHPSNLPDEAAFN